MKMKLVWMHIKDRVLEIRQSPLLWVLIGVLIVGLALRVWGISFGLPNLFHADEGFEVNRALQLASGSFDFTRIGKGGYFYVLFIDFGLLFVFLKLVGTVDSTKDFAMLFISDPSYFYLMGRFTTALIGTLSLFLVYQVGSRIYSRLVGVVAAVILCANVLHTKLSHFITVDVPLTCLCLASFLFIFRVLNSNKISNYLWSGAFIAMAAMTKMPGLILMVPFFVAHISRQKNESSNILLAILDKKWILGCLLMVLLYAIGNPGIVVSFKSVVTGVLSLYSPHETPVEGLEVAVDHDQFSPLAYYVNALSSAMGSIVLALSLVGVLLALYKPKMEAVLLILFGFVFFLALVLSADPTLVYERYVLPIVPILAVFIARLIVMVSELLTNQLRINRSAPPLFLAILLSVMGVKAVVADNRQLLTEDSRSAARNWIETNLPANAKILTEGFTAKSYPGSVPLLNSEENIRHAIEYFKASGEPGKARYFQLELEANQHKKRFDLELYNDTNLSNLDRYLAQGVDYIVVRPDAMKGSLKYLKIGEAFLESIHSHSELELVKSFEGVRVEGGEGPYIEIYKVNMPDS